MKDRFLTFTGASGQAITATAVSTDLIDLRAARQMAVGREIWLIVHLTVAMTDAANDSTVTVTLESDDSAAFGSATTQMTLTVFSALSAAGTMRKVVLPVFPAAERFIRLNFTVANGNLSTGTFDAYLALAPQEATKYASGYTF